MKWLTFSFLAIGLTAACQNPPTSNLENDLTAAPADSAFTIAHGKGSPIEDTLRVVIHDSTALHGFLEQYGLTDEAEQWRTDFEQQSVVVVTMGERSNLGYDICVDSIRPAPGGSTVNVTRAEGGWGAQAMSHPWHVVRTRTQEGPYAFSETVLAETVWCGRSGAEEP